MKRVILLGLVSLHIAISVFLYYIGHKFVFIDEMMSNWLSSLIFSLVLATIIIFIKRESINTLFKSLIFVYPISLLLLLFLVFSSIPTYSYKEAVELVQKKTGEEVLQSIHVSHEIEGQMGHYFIYINNDVYIFNAESGDFAKR